MLFLTIFFAFYYGYALIRGRLFYDLQLESLEFNIKKAKDKSIQIPTELGIKTLFLVLYLVTLLIFTLVYLVKATVLDPFLYPTVCLILIHFIMFLSGTIEAKKRDLTDEKKAMRALVKQQERYSFKGIFFNLLFLTYFVYMFLVLVELI